MLCFVSGLSPQDVQVVELHDCFSANELITYEALGLCEEGKELENKVLMKIEILWLSRYVPVAERFPLPLRRYSKLPEP